MWYFPSFFQIHVGYRALLCGPVGLYVYAQAQTSGGLRGGARGAVAPPPREQDELGDPPYKNGDVE